MKVNVTECVGSDAGVKVRVAVAVQVLLADRVPAGPGPVAVTLAVSEWVHRVGT